MTKSPFDRLRDILACPNCGASLDTTARGVRCTGCAETYPSTHPGQLDVRLRSPKRYPFEFPLGTPAPTLPPARGSRKGAPEVDFAGLRIPRHLTPAILAHFPRAAMSGSRVLDLGCGNAVHRPVCERAGFEYIGLDIDTPEAEILGDAHALPFKDDSFEFILSIAVLEHIRYPFVMTRETWRVLKPGGRLIGTVAFLEPHHGGSFYHHSHLGVLNSLTTAGFTVEQIAPNTDWPVLVAQATMALFPRLPRALSRSIVLPIHLLHRLWWKLGYALSRSETASEQHRLLSTAGSFFFVASKR